jgi:hypothetical protein
MKNVKPILFSTPMVQAILRDEKTQTRRIMQEQPPYQLLSCGTSGRYWADNPEDLRAKYFRCKYEIGDILWVRETFQILPPNMVFYKADCYDRKDIEYWKWKPSIFMPKEACRIFLKLTNIRVERLNDISENDSLMEGIRAFTKDNSLFKHGLDGWEWQSMPKYAKEAYRMLWDKINGKGSWNLNPFVWVYDFERDFEFHF